MKACRTCGTPREGRVCKPCRTEVNRRYRAAHPDTVKANWANWRANNKERIQSNTAHRQLTKRAECLIAHARTRARRKKLRFDLDQPHVVADIKRRVDAGVCELTGISFDLTPGRTFASPSLDRHVPDEGYVHTNVRVVCHGINAALGNWGEDALMSMVKGYFFERFRFSLDIESLYDMEVVP